MMMATMLMLITKEPLTIRLQVINIFIVNWYVVYREPLSISGDPMKCGPTGTAKSRITHHGSSSQRPIMNLILGPLQEVPRIFVILHDSPHRLCNFITTSPILFQNTTAMALDTAALSTTVP